jgi:hypothetical protein
MTDPIDLEARRDKRDLDRMEAEEEHYYAECGALGLHILNLDVHPSARTLAVLRELVTVRLSTGETLDAIEQDVFRTLRVMFDMQRLKA